MRHLKRECAFGLISRAGLYEWPISWEANEKRLIYEKTMGRNCTRKGPLQKYPYFRKCQKKKKKEMRRGFYWVVFPLGLLTPSVYVGHEKATTMLPRER